MKKYLAILLTAALLLCAAPLAGFAALDWPELHMGNLFHLSAKAAEIVDSGFCGAEGDGSNLTWTLDSDGLLTISGSGEMKNYDWYRSPWYDNTAIKTVVIQNDVTSIGANAFRGCTGLTSVTIPDSVTSIGAAAFSDCTGLMSVTIPDSVTSIGDAAFSDCTGLMSVTIPDSVTSIGHSAFYGCVGLTQVIIPNSVTSIGINVFSGCTGLTQVTLPDSATSIVVDMFSGCTGLTSVTLPNSVTRIEDCAFKDCTGLTSVTLPDSVTSIGYEAFSSCTGLTSVTLPDSVMSIETNPFSNCKGLKAITVDAENPVYFSKGNCLIEKESKTLVSGCKSSIIPADGSVTSIGNYVFYGCAGLPSVTIPDGVTSIGNYAFHACTGLTSVTLPDSVTSIGNYAFSGCSGLTSVTLPDSVKVIGNNAFRACAGLTSVTIPDSVTSIGRQAFTVCSGLTSIILPQSVSEILPTAIPPHTVIYGYIGSYAQQWAEENNRAFVPIGDAAVALNTPNMVNEPSVNIYGFANPGADVVCSVNGAVTVTVQAAANGRWSAAIPLTGAKDGDSFAIKATVTVDGKTAEETATVTYKPDAIVLQEFTLNHSCYSTTVRGVWLGVSVPNFTFIPGQPLAFRIKVSNNDRVKKLSVVSTKDGDSRQMELTYDADSGYWFANGYFDNADENYVPGVFTVKGTDKDGKEFDTGVTIKINFLIDPSGFAYEAVTSNKLEGVTAAVYYKDEKGHELLWNAETADQLNPVTTLSDGAFAWVVPEGQWQVRLTKPGYLEARSQWMDVPPEYTDVYLGMAAEAAPEAAYVNVYADRAELTFSQYMDLNTVNTDNVKFDGYTGAIVPLDAVEESEGSGNRYAKTFAFTPEKPFTGEIGVRIENAANYVGTPLASPYTATFTVAAEPKNLTATQDVSVVYGKTAEVTVAAENAAGKTVSVSCDSANVTLSDKTLTLDETGKATLSVTGEMPGIANLTFALDGTTLTAAAKASVTVPGVPAEPELPTDPENPATPTDPDGPDKPAYTLGDVDGDGEVSSGDARLALRASVQLEKYEKGSAAFLAADADKNGEIESSDARTILRVSVKLESFA